METRVLQSLAALLGPWVEPEWESGLIDRCREAWSKPIPTLTRAELAMLLRQRIGTTQILEEARRRLRDVIDDDSELYEGELLSAVSDAEKTI